MPRYLIEGHFPNGLSVARGHAEPDQHLCSVRADSRFDDAMALLQEGRCASAFRIFAALADEGHGTASRVALMLTRRGASLFGGRYPATVEQRARWQRLTSFQSDPPRGPGDAR